MIKEADKVVNSPMEPVYDPVSVVPLNVKFAEAPKSPLLLKTTCSLLPGADEPELEITASANSPM